MLWTINNVIGNLRIFHHLRRVEHAQFHPCCEKSFYRPIDLRFGDEALLHCLFQRRINASAIQISSGNYAQSRCLGRGFNNFVSGVKIPDSAAIGDYVSFKTPIVAKNFIEQKIAAATGFAAESIVGAHHGVGATLDNAHAEMGEIGLAKIPIIHNCIERMSVRLGAAVHSVMFDRGDQF